MDERYTPSGKNTRFHNELSTFADYQARMTDIVINTRLDLVSDNREVIITANTPQDFSPNTPTTGILLVHGLFDCPGTLSSLFDHFAGQNTTVRSVLLPGHGTRPGDLLEMNAAEWIKAVNFALRTLEEDVETVIIVGVSTGAALAIHQAYTHPKVRGLVLFSPALRILSNLVKVCHYTAYLGLHYPEAAWFTREAEIDYEKYSSMPYNAFYQVYRLSRVLQHLTSRETLSIPQCLIATQDDEMVSCDAMIEYLNQQPHPLCEGIIYGETPLSGEHTRLTLRPSRYPTEQIINFSHTSLSASPTHPHYGKNGDFKDFRHYDRYWGKAFEKNRQKDCVLGAVSKDNLKHHNLQRLNYNPDFDYLLSRIDRFIHQVTVA